MITKVKIQGYRKYKNFTFRPNPRLNLIVGSNESGKSTLTEAIALALTGRINGRTAAEELNPYWFNIEIVEKFVRSRTAGKRVTWPEICIELFFEDCDELQQLCGAINSDVPTNACPGTAMRVFPDPEYADELEEWAKRPSNLLPVEYYKIDWRSFADTVITSRPKHLATAIIDSRTVRSTTGVDYHMRYILNDGLKPAERAAISVAYREIKASLSNSVLKSVNDRMAEMHASLHDQPISLSMDQSARTSWEGAVTPHVNNVPFSMAGQGQQAAIKISLAMSRHSESAAFVMIEEPENHLTYTSLTTLLQRMESLAGEHQQLFITTHSSFVINRMGLNSLHLLGGSNPYKIDEMEESTVRYFQKLPGYDTLRMVLSNKIVLVEGPSDEIIFERIFRDKYGYRPMELGIDVISLHGLSFHRCLELCAALDKYVAAIRDNDGAEPDELTKPLEEFLVEGRREFFIGKKDHGGTLEPQLLFYNGEMALREVLGISENANLSTWMKREKTEAALRIASAQKSIIPPQYMLDATSFIHG
ncbi:putative ATP-dependent endonuclease of OLD family [Desulfosalsimonas propionicica]|uniref:Putative ATP-dependent endonuclease of OLD family n=1 Tax=Desulfosalsimonas propionicica TaxID=332175 RepID=A0A7W0CAH0_9BACT|nr:AAA family ATPase [Desulfosalsimonas propionicica]MBA2882072.1 putative ATP-dependent endonuclease of OLD family [Desulfosalsimonas propionicica]